MRIPERLDRAHIKSLAPLLFACVALGVLVDFAFNGVFIGFLFNQPFTEKLAFFYLPLFIATAMTLANRLLHHPRWHPHVLVGVGAFVAGAALGHLTLVGHRGVRTYVMDVDTGYGSILLRSSDWPQILFVTSEKVRQELASNYKNREVPIQVDVITDYGCDRAAIIRTVAGVDVRHDDAATWTWQVDRMAGGVFTAGPGSEDSHFFWCRRPPPIKAIELNPAGTRPWEQHGSSGKTS